MFVTISHCQIPSPTSSSISFNFSSDFLSACSFSIRSVTSWAITRILSSPFSVLNGFFIDLKCLILPVAASKLSSYTICALPFSIIDTTLSFIASDSFLGTPKSLSYLPIIFSGVVPYNCATVLFPKVNLPSLSFITKTSGISLIIFDKSFSFSSSCFLSLNDSSLDFTLSVISSIIAIK